MREAVVSPALWTAVAFVLLSPFIHSAGCYLFLRSFQIAPNGEIAWFAIVLFTVGPVASFVYGIRTALRSGRQPDKAIARRVSRHSLWFIMGSMILVKLVIAPAVALTVWNSWPTDDAPRPGKGKIAPITRQDQLASLLRRLETEGIFTWFGQD